MDTKQCKRCSKIDNKENFAKNRLMCKSCYSEHQKQKRLKNIDKLKKYDKKRYTGERKMKQLETSQTWYSKNKEHVKFRNIKKIYGLDKEQYQSMVKSNKNKCEICKKYCKNLCVDHNHKTGDIRGIICNNCNGALGFFQDSVHILKSAIKYLEKSKSKEEDFTIGYSGYFFGAKKGVHLGRINTQ